MKAVAGSFRDPSGNVFFQEGQLLRSVNQSYASHYEFLNDSGLYQELVSAGMLIPHEEVEPPQDCYRVLKPEIISPVTYPQEWSFGMLKDAALLCLRIHLKALENGMILKDASPYNILFRGNKAVWIDTLSFEQHVPGEPWIAYRQFCEQFLAPLAVMHYKDAGINMLKMYPAGLPLGIAVKLLPFRALFNTGVYLNLFLHSRVQQKSSKKKVRKVSVSKSSLIGHCNMLLRMVSGMDGHRNSAKHWKNYYEEKLLSAAYAEDKEAIVKKILNTHKAAIVWDFGANTGVYSKLAATYALKVLALEKDHASINKLYISLKREAWQNIYPLVFDLLEPLPSAGWDASERVVLQDRIDCNLALVLALSHHLAMAENLPYEKISAYFAGLTPLMIYEFVPPEDPNAARMLEFKPDLVERTGEMAFRAAFEKDWEFLQSNPVKNSQRVIFLLKRKFHEKKA
jgi:hypothetical protein